MTGFHYQRSSGPSVESRRARIIKSVLVAAAFAPVAACVDSLLWANQRIGNRTAKELASWLDSAAPEKEDSQFRFYDSREGSKGILAASRREIHLLEIEYGQMEFEVVADGTRYWINYTSHDRKVWILRRFSTEPNQSSQRNAMAELFSVFESRSSRR
jgi:hypothetical protein